MLHVEKEIDKKLESCLAIVVVMGRWFIGQRCHESCSTSEGVTHVHSGWLKCITLVLENNCYIVTMKINDEWFSS